MWLQVRSGDDAGRVVEVPDVEDRPFVLGRVQGADYVIRDERASRRHLQLVPLGDGRLHLKDLGSANGTFIAGERVHERVLLGGEELQVGDVRIGVLREPPDSAPRVATESMVRRMVDERDRRTRVGMFAALGLGAVAVVVAVAVLWGDDEGSVPDVVRALEPATVRVEAAEGGSGSGWVLDAGDGLVVTNAHVVNAGSEHTVGGRAAAVVGVAPCEDLALLRVEGASGLETAPLGPPPEQGETVVALGFPADAGAGLASTTGVVSVVSTTFDDPAPDVPAYRDVIQTDSALNPGNSGGPLADLEGRVVGVNAAARSRGSDGRPLQGVNYAIAIDHAREVLSQLRTGRSPGWFGARFAYPTVEELAERELPPGLAIAGVAEGSAAAEAGLEAGDLLVGVDGRQVRETLASYCAAIAEVGPGRVTLTLARPGGGTREVEVAIG